VSTPLEQWVESVARLTRPARIQWCDGSEGEAARIDEQLIREGHTFPLNDKTYPNCVLHRSDPSDVARTEKVTFICTQQERRRRTDQ
jgi:phosphoenolpyruvate carboxykinase (GTP)